MKMMIVAIWKGGTGFQFQKPWTHVYYFHAVWRRTFTEAAASAASFVGQEATGKGIWNPAEPSQQKTQSEEQELDYKME